MYPIHPFLQAPDDVLTPPTFLAGWCRVASRKGSAGIDGETIPDFAANMAANLDALHSEIHAQTYRPRPLRAATLVSPGGKQRQLAIPTVRDRVAQAAVLEVIRAPLEATLQPAAFAYRTGLSYLDAVRQVCCYRDEGCRWVLRGDVQAFFDSIPHDKLLRLLRQHGLPPLFLALSKLWMRTPVWYRGRMLPRPSGLPLGAVVSPLLSNLYLNPFDTTLARQGFRLVRYSDDFVICCRSRAEAEAACACAQDALEHLDLFLHPEKTRITSFERGFRFLGTRFHGEHAIRHPVSKPRVCLTSPASSSQPARHNKPNRRSVSPKAIGHKLSSKRACQVQKSPVLRAAGDPKSGRRVSIRPRRASDPALEGVSPSFSRHPFST